MARQRRLSREEVIDVLSQKKLALHQEVEDFRREKEEEFRRFEEELRQQFGRPEEENAEGKEPETVANTQEHDETKDVLAIARAEGSRNEAGDPVQKDQQGTLAPLSANQITIDNPSEGRVKEQVQSDTSDISKSEAHRHAMDNHEGGSIQKLEPQERKSKKNRVEKDHEDSLMKVNGGQYPMNKDERELELRALFTPSYLPLLEDNSHRQFLRDRDIPGDKSKHQRHHSDTTKLSSSLTTLPSLSNSKSEAGSLSSSQPRLGLTERRSSSSPTGTGRTLRSSLRSPDHVPKERKHVLFSIDDKVISPSTSPAATRSNMKKGQKGQRTPPIPFSGLKDFPFPDMSAPAAINMPKKPPSISVSEASKAVPPSTNSPNHFARSYKDLVEPTIMTPPEEVDKEDLKIEESNPMFDLDDRGNGGNAALEYDEVDWDIGGRYSRQSEEEEGEEDRSAKIAASPHRGSVPIEIRWSGRRTS